jgi:hypothetical protein
MSVSKLVDQRLESSLGKFLHGKRNSQVLDREIDYMAGKGGGSQLHVVLLTTDWGWGGWRKEAGGGALKQERAGLGQRQRRGEDRRGRGESSRETSSKIRYYIDY